MIFAEEEGTTFGPGMLGSRAWVGDLSAQQLAAWKNAAEMKLVERVRHDGSGMTRQA